MVIVTAAFRVALLKQSTTNTEDIAVFEIVIVLPCTMTLKYE
jgi:hypothetical protein